MHDVEEKKRGQQTVAGGAPAGEDDVAGLFTAERGAGGEHLLEDIFVAYRRAKHLYSIAFEGGF